MVGTQDHVDGFDQAEFERRRERRNVAIAWGIVAFVVLVFSAFIARFTVPKSINWGDGETVTQPEETKVKPSEPSQNGGK